jgi:ring-1,2-phenylacetyl-CoA epoxidase subunit PaaE
MFSRLRALRRDLAAVAATFTARPAAPATSAASTKAAPSGASTLTPRRLRIAQIVRETADAVSLVLEDPTGAPIAFSPGQFFTLHVPVAGEVHKRAYSASSSALDGKRVSVTVKRVHDGRVSRHLVGHAHEGDAIDVLGPSGSFTPWSSQEPRLLVLVGGGSGITPLSSIARTLLASEPGTRLALIYGNGALEDVIFKDSLEALAAEHGGDSPRFRVRHVLERPHEGWTGGTGRLDGQALARELDALGDPELPRAEYYLCGPAPMMAAAREALEKRGIAPQRIHEERFVSAHAAAGAPASTSEQEVTLRMRDGERRIQVAPGRTVLETALDAGIDMPFSCAVGGCGTCRVRLSRGSVVMDEPNCLSAEERSDGYVLACVSRPTAACTLEVP